MKNHYALFMALCLICIISAITYHYDFYTLTLMAQRVANGDFNLYKPFDVGPIWNQIRGTNEPLKCIAPPLIYLLDGFTFYIYRLFHIINFTLTDQIPSLWQIFILKSRYIIFFILSYPLIKRVAYEYTKNQDSSKRIANIWIASPLLLLLPFSQGNNDIYPVIFILIFLFFSFKKSYIRAMIFLGLAACLKNYALFLIFPAALILSEKDIAKTIKYSLISIMAYILPSLLYIRHLKFFLTGGGEGLFVLNTYIPSYIPFALFPIAYFAIILFLIFNNNKEDFAKNKTKMLVYYLFLINSLFFVTSFFYPQWLLWILPFIALLVYKNKKLFYLYIMLSSTLSGILITFYSKILDINLFRPIFTSGVKYFQFPLNPKVNSLFLGLFLAIYGVLIYFVTKDRDKNFPLQKERNYVLISFLPSLGFLLFALLNLVISNYLHF